MGRLIPCNCRTSSLAVVRCWTPIVFIQLGNYWFGLSWKCRLAPKLQVFGFSGVWVFITCWWVSSEAEKCVTSVINSWSRDGCISKKRLLGEAHWCGWDLKFRTFYFSQCKVHTWKAKHSTCCIQTYALEQNIRQP